LDLGQHLIGTSGPSGIAEHKENIPGVFSSGLTARIERPPFYRGDSASKKEGCLLSFVFFHLDPFLSPV
jgi:hypothetical protein